MTYNDKLSDAYGKSNLIPSRGGLTATAYRPIPLKADYDSGILTRYFCQRVGTSTIVEVNAETAQSLSSDFFIISSLTWKIIGPKDVRRKGAIIESYGVVESNRREISRVLQVTGLDLSRYLTNLTEFWRGY